MLSGLKGYWRGVPVAGVLIFIAALICSIVRLGFLPGLEHGWLSAVKAAIVLGILWPVPVLAIIALLVWVLPAPQLVPAPHPTRP